MRTRLWRAAGACLALSLTTSCAAGLRTDRAAPPPAAVPAADVRPFEAEPARSPKCAAYQRRSVARAALVTGEGRRIVVLGDSWAVGGHKVGGTRTWPVHLPGEVHVAGFPGSAYSQRDAGACGGVSFADRAPGALAGGADLVVVEGGLNDANRSGREIRAGFEALMERLAGYDVVVLAPPPTPSHAARIGRVDALLTKLTAAAGVPYVPTFDIPITYLPDGLHPDRAGHATFGRAVAERLAALGLL